MPRFQQFITTLLIITIAGWEAWTILPHYASQALEAWVLDVGQGESVLVREPSGKKLLFDGGPDDSVLNQLGAVLTPWDRSLDTIILSHNHTDHFFGLIGVLNRFKVGEIWLSGATSSSADFGAFQKTVIQSGVLVHRPIYFDAEHCSGTCPPIQHFGQANIQVYHPLQDMTGMNPTEQHDATISIKVSYANYSIFLAGDLNEQHEQDMLNACRAPLCHLASTILQIPHHGSATGLAPNFLGAIQPKYAVIPVGLHNTFHHPTPIILARLKDAHIPYFRTDTQGRIHIQLPKTGRPIMTVGDDP